MFHTTATFLTLLGVLLHAATGCCAHHDHSESSISAAPANDQQEARRCCCRSHAYSTTEEAREEASDHSSCPRGEHHEECCSDHCSWLTHSRVELPTDDGTVLPFALPDVWSVHGSAAALIANRFATQWPRVSEPTASLRARTLVLRL